MRSTTRSTIMTITLAAILAVSGCAPASTAPSEAVSAQLEQTVLVITQAVVDSDWASADRDLDALEAQVETALAAGELSEERAVEIRAAIALVRADVAAGIEQTAPIPEPTEPPEPIEQPDDDKDDDAEKPGNRGGNRDKDDD